MYRLVVILGALAVIAALAAWLVHPAMMGEMRDAGKWLVGLLITAVTIIAIVLLASRRKPRL